MQWLIDIVAEKVIAEIGIPPCWIQRPDFDGNDFLKEALTIDNAWHELDVSAIVPAGASAAHFHIKVDANTIGGVIYMRPRGRSEFTGTCKVRPQVAGQPIAYFPTVGLDSSRIIEYRISSAVWVLINIKIEAWLL